MRSIQLLLLGLLIGGVWQAKAQVSSYDYVPDASYEEIADRISCIEGAVPLHYNEKVKNFIDYFTIRDRDYTRQVLNNAELFFPIFEAALAKYGVPDELKYLSVVESGLRPNAISRASAVGLWQFMSATGRMYGLKNDWYLDDRMDPVASSDAAARHLKDLYSMFGDWELALAAYNCGPGNVRKAMRRSGYQSSFWDIYAYLPRETRSYVPQFVAVVYAMKYAPEHNLFPDEYRAFPASDTILVNQYFHLETFANQINLCVEDLMALNPHIKRGALPEGTREFALRIPYDIKDSVFMKNRLAFYDTAGKVGKQELDYLARNMSGSTFGRVKQQYRVRSGDVLGTIAERYHVRVADLREWNHISGNMIRVGQTLNIWVLPAYNSQTKSLYASSGVSDSDPTSGVTTASSGQKVYYVQSGDTLWSIANQHSNLSIEQLKKLNNLNSNTIKPGQLLIISSE